MLRRPACSAAFVLCLLAAGSRAAAADAPAYSPLPPPPPPPAELAAPPPPPAGRAPARPPPTAAQTSTTSTTSAPVGSAAEGPRVDPDAPGSAPASPSTSNLDDTLWSIAPLLGFGTDGLELGLGARVGRVAFGEHVWVGGSAVYHVGHSTAGAVNNVRYEASSSAFYLGPEIGYDVELGAVLLRPYAGVGLAAFTASASTGGVRASDTTTRLLLWPGATVLYGFAGSRFFAGGDARLVTIPGGPAFALSALAGLTL